MREIFNITERESTHPLAKLEIIEEQPGRFKLMTETYNSANFPDGYAKITLDRAELLQMACRIIQRLDIMPVGHVNGDIVLVPAFGQITENDIVKVAK